MGSAFEPPTVNRQLSTVNCRLSTSELTWGGLDFEDVRHHQDPVAGSVGGRHLLLVERQFLVMAAGANEEAAIVRSRFPKHGADRAWTRHSKLNVVISHESLPTERW